MIINLRQMIIRMRFSIPNIKTKSIIRIFVAIQKFHFHIKQLKKLFVFASNSSFKANNQSNFTKELIFRILNISFFRNIS